jgi:hypothetical protein
LVGVWWHFVHAAVVCRVSCGNRGVAFAWLYVEGDHPGFVVWHFEQSVANPVCGTGVVADVNWVWWQE